MDLRVFILSLLLLGCHQEQIDCTLKGHHCHRINPTPPEDQEITDLQKEQLLKLKENIKEWVLYCESGIACGENDDHQPESGDSMLWGGLLCLSGDNDQCDATKASQDPQTGALYRNPTGSRGINDSSRDMLLGFLAYLAATKDQEAANLLLAYIESNSYKLCTNASDNRCSVPPTISSPLWGTMKGVWLYIGLNPTSAMNKGDVGSSSIVNLESQFSTEGYPLHLIGVEILVKQFTDRYSYGLSLASSNLLKREPNNPFFEYLAKGKTSRAAQLVLEKCPTTGDHLKKQWAWQRTESEQAWLQSKGWDCIFLIDLLLK